MEGEPPVPFLQPAPQGQWSLCEFHEQVRCSGPLCKLCPPPKRPSHSPLPVGLILRADLSVVGRGPILSCSGSAYVRHLLLAGPLSPFLGAEVQTQLVDVALGTSREALADGNFGCWSASLAKLFTRPNGKARSCPGLV